MGRFLVEAGLEVIAPSRPGYPGTPLLGRTGIDQQADLHASLLDALEIPASGLITWSGGGPSGYRLAVLHPERVSALVAFVSVSGRWEPPASGIDERLIEDTDFGNWILRFITRHAPKSTISSTLAAEGDLDRKEVKALVAEAMEAKTSGTWFTMAAVVADRQHRREGLDNDYARFAGSRRQLGRITARPWSSTETRTPTCRTARPVAASTIPRAARDHGPGNPPVPVRPPECGRFQSMVSDHLRRRRLNRLVRLGSGLPGLQTPTLFLSIRRCASGSSRSARRSRLRHLVDEAQPHDQPLGLAELVHRLIIGILDPS
jgi:pimeloyl-ACP methyl ester carboxylesterase